MELKEKILAYMRKDAYKPLTAEDLIEGLTLYGDELALFWDVIKELEENAEIIRTRHDKFGVPERMNLVVGILSVTVKGFGFVIPEYKEEPEDTDVFIPVSLMLSAMHNDRVVARVNRPGIGGKTREGEIIRIVKRANQRIVGTFESSKSFGFVVPDDAKIGQDIFVARQDFNGAKIGTKVVVEITKWPESRRSAEGRVIEVLGYVGDPGVDILSIIKKHDLDMGFPEKVQKEANKTPDQIVADEIKGRRDLRDVPIVTIDGDDAKDLDDGVYVKRLEHGAFFVSVHIADVSYYVRENTALDLEARNRGTSVYLVDRVLPMLPPRLSNGICSLNAGEDRLALSIEMEIDGQGRVTRYEIFPSVIHVYRRLTYNVVKKILVEEDPLLTNDNEDILPMLKDMQAACQVLNKRRSNRGSIDFDLPEVKVRLDSEGKPVKLIKRERNLAESIIEEFMLLANETVAEHMLKKQLPSVYRVHEEPAMEKIDKLNELLANFALHIVKPSGEDAIEPSLFQSVLAKVQGRPEEKIISSVMLRSMKQARYEAQNLGHFGLAAKFYTHFTSPIRRYPDLIVHRMLHESFQAEKLSTKRCEKLNILLPEIAKHSSNRERLAAEAERETVELKKIEYMEQFIGDKFSGIINGVTAFGLFVELDNGVEGLVRVSSMEDDYYQYIEEQYALVGERTKKVYRLGDETEVIVIHASVETKTIDFILADNGTFVAMPPKAPRSRTKTPADSHSAKRDVKSDPREKVGRHKESDKKAKKKNKNSRSRVSKEKRAKKRG